MPCTTASYDDRAAGMVAQRVVKRTFRANTSLYHCDACDHYHARVEVGRYPISEDWRVVLECIAQGMTAREITLRTRFTRRYIDQLIYEMLKRFYALNRPHLIAIAISLGILDPNSFVPSIEETHESSKSA